MSRSPRSVLVPLRRPSPTAHSIGHTLLFTDGRTEVTVNPSDVERVAVHRAPDGTPTLYLRLRTQALVRFGPKAHRMLRRSRPERRTGYDAAAPLELLDDARPYLRRPSRSQVAA